jgi:ABC-type transport system involved in cytochrome bd biosynthesis fused ATPase/permease subunit
LPSLNSNLLHDLKKSIVRGTIRKDLLFVNPDAINKELLKVLRQTDYDPALERASRGLTIIGEGEV